MRVVAALEPLLSVYRFDDSSVHDRHDALWSVLFSAPYDGVADRFGPSPFDGGDVPEGERADLYVIGSIDDGVLGVDFEGAPLVDLLREADLTTHAARLESSLGGDVDTTLARLSDALRAFFS